MSVFEEKRKPEYPKKLNLPEQGREPTTNSTHINGMMLSLAIEPRSKLGEETAPLSYITLPFSIIKGMAHLLGF